MSQVECDKLDFLIGDLCVIVKVFDVFMLMFFVYKYVFVEEVGYIVCVGV